MHRINRFKDYGFEKDMNILISMNPTNPNSDNGQLTGDHFSRILGIVNGYVTTFADGKPTEAPI